MRRIREDTILSRYTKMAIMANKLGRTPTLRELMSEWSIKSTSAAKHNLSLMKERGWVEFKDHRYKITGQIYHAPETPIAG